MHLQGRHHYIQNFYCFSFPSTACSPSNFFINHKSALSNLIVMGTRPDGTLTHGCRTSVWNRWVPGTYNVKTESCYISEGNQEYRIDADYTQVLTNPNPKYIRLIWWDCNFSRGNGKRLVGGSDSGGNDIFVVRCRHTFKSGSDGKIWIPGRYSGNRGVYNYAGYVRDCVEIEFLICKIVD
jgi:hypothetical protein